ncbi:DUF7311 family protein [Halovenus salina]|uniref:DUF7311 domain-containing protein n=1 Tax=Halovenus salina TaxID=1510225 RepID=A0ABD5VY93_9EURY|nr:hypothetical protein [Halovenus salina]
MIRYVVAVLLATALLGVGFVAVERVSAVRAETQLNGELSAIERAAASLLEHDDPTPAGPPPRRVLDVRLPTAGFATVGVETLVFEPVGNRTVVRYQLGGRPATTRILDVALVNAVDGARTLDVSGRTGSQTVVLELVTDPGNPTVQMRFGNSHEVSAATGQNRPGTS